MIRKELYQKTTDILFNAYFNNTLEHGNCYACAVGNMVAANLGLKFIAHDHAILRLCHVWDGTTPQWDNVFSTPLTVGSQFVREDNYFGEAKMQIDATGYTWQELAKIEYAFESAPKGNSEEDYMFNGLCAVLNVLKEIHQASEDDEISNDRFVHHYQKRVSNHFS